ncbi:hypothetical protein HF325_005107 [Metschnikowia pulcherrima]|uniref:U1 small nuclear ribonucleoprotein component SNU71 n=1 Tax=Metschnikowia pulcherrima TaxID=27326 RepID=A0A8H7L9V9_9ASCO|nr:hypothetical protein HF325_005107 [Metschnikowia pulcherrima]
MLGAEAKDANAVDEEKARRKQRKAEERCLNLKVDISKVSMSVIKQWMTEKLAEELPDDDVALEFIYELLVVAENELPDIGAIREQMNDFLGKEKSRDFCVGLWQLLLSAQVSPGGIPQQLVDERKAKFERDEEAREQADQILQQLRPKPSFAKGKTQRNKVSFKEYQDRKSNLPTTGSNRVDKSG